MPPATQPAAAHPPAAQPPVISVAGLEHVAALGWRAAEEERLGDWLLRAADGFTGRANSALAVGDPGMPLPAAVEQVVRWYAGRCLPAMFAVPFTADGPQDPGSPRAPAPGACPGPGHGSQPGDVDRYLAGRGWGIRANAATVMTASPRMVPRRSPSAAVRIDLTPEPDDAWLACYHYGGRELPPAALSLLMSAPWQAFASARTGGRTVAIGRVAVGSRWGGLTAVEVRPAHRRQGLASAITAALADAAVSHGATGLYLQVVNGNSAAHQLYRRMGFTEHHRYHYRVAPTTAAGSGSGSGSGS